MPETTIIKDLVELGAFAKNLLTYLSENQDKYHVIALSGDLGAGKTAFVQQLAKELGIDEVVTSPTFTIMKQYQVPQPNQFKQLFHMDAYRLDSLDEVRPLGISELMKSKTNLLCIEWAEKIEEVLPEGTIYLSFKISNEDNREVVLKLKT